MPLLPHLVSLSRPLVGLAIFVSFPRTESWLLLPLVAAAVSTDWIDGQIARRSGQATKAGRVVDNLCDFFLLLLLFAFFAQAEIWSPPVWGRLARSWELANWLPAYALLCSFGLYFVRLCLDLAAGREPARSPRGHLAGVMNYGLAIGGAAEMLPGFSLGPWILEPAMVSIAILNAFAVGENLLLLLRPPPGTR